MENNCPKCGYNLGDHTCVTEEDATPVAGDVGICLECKTILVYNDDLSQREPTAEEIESMKADPEFWNEIQMAIYVAKEVR
jgi:hypothetical protein